MFILGASGAGAQSTVKIVGRVTDATTGKPLILANVAVQGTGFGASTDARGYFIIENLLEGSYTVTASHIGYAPRRMNDVRVVKDRPVRVNFSLRPTVIRLPALKVNADPFTDPSGLTVSVVDRKVIDYSGDQSVGEILEHVPGVEIQDSGGLGSSKKITIRGSQANQVLVLLDGMPLNDPLGGDADLSTIPANIIERIEVYKGGNASRFGNGALGGVVNIRTRRHFSNQLQVGGGLGSCGFIYAEPSISGRFNGFGYFLSLKTVSNQGNYPYTYIDSEGERIREDRINADMKAHNGFVRLDYRWDGHTVAAQAQHLVSKRGIPGKIDGWTAYARADNVQDILGVEYRKDWLRSTFRMNGRYSSAETENANLYPEDADKKYRRYPRWNYVYRTRNVILQSEFESQPVDWLSVSAGYAGRILRYRDENRMAFFAPPIQEAEDLSQGLFLHQEYRLGIPWLHGRLSLNPQIRYDRMSLKHENANRIERQWSPGIGLVLSMGDQNRITLKSHLSRSFRAPTFADLFYQDVRIEGKPDLLPEKSRNAEFGLDFEFMPWGRITGGITMFRNSIEDLIVWKLGSFEVFRPYNTDARITGQEFTFEWATPGDLVIVGMGYTHLDPLNKSDETTTRDKILPYRPQESLKAHVTLDMQRFHGSIRYRRVGKRFITEANTVEMPAYEVVDLDLAWTIDIGPIELVWKGSVINLLNASYEIIRDMPMPGREWRLGLAMKI